MLVECFLEEVVQFLALSVEHFSVASVEGEEVMQFLVLSVEYFSVGFLVVRVEVVQFSAMLVECFSEEVVQFLVFYIRIISYFHDTFQK